MYYIVSVFDLFKVVHFKHLHRPDLWAGPKYLNKELFFNCNTTEAIRESTLMNLIISRISWKNTFFLLTCWYSLPHNFWKMSAKPFFASGNLLNDFPTQFFQSFFFSGNWNLRNMKYWDIIYFHIKSVIVEKFIFFKALEIFYSMFC